MLAKQKILNSAMVWKSQVETSLINSLKSYDNFTDKHLFGKNIVQEDLCEWGEDVHSSEHIFLDCKMFKNNRDSSIKLLNS